MMAQSREESPRDIYNYGQYINQFPPNTIKAIQQYKWIQKKICRQKMSIMFNEICIYKFIYICVCVCVCVIINTIQLLQWRILIYIFTNPSTRAGYDTWSIFKQSLTGLNLEFSFSYTSHLTKAEEPSLPHYLPIAGGRIIGFIPFPRVLMLCEMQSVSSRI